MPHLPSPIGSCIFIPFRKSYLPDPLQNCSSHSPDCCNSPTAPPPTPALSVYIIIKGGKGDEKEMQKKIKCVCKIIFLQRPLLNLIGGYSAFLNGMPETERSDFLGGEGGGCVDKEKGCIVYNGTFFFKFRFHDLLLKNPHWSAISRLRSDVLSLYFVR